MAWIAAQARGARDESILNQLLTPRDQFHHPTIDIWFLAGL